MTRRRQRRLRRIFSREMRTTALYYGGVDGVWRRRHGWRLRMHAATTLLVSGRGQVGHWLAIMKANMLPLPPAMLVEWDAVCDRIMAGPA